MSEPTTLQIDNIEDALSPFEVQNPVAGDKAVAVLVSVLNKLLKEEELELEEISQLEGENVPTRARQTYALSYLKVLDFLRRKAEDSKEREAQARVALGYVRHAESHSLSILQLGREKGDAALKAEISALQEKVQGQAVQMARGMSKDVTPPRDQKENGSGDRSQEGKQPKEAGEEKAT